MNGIGRVIKFLYQKEIEALKKRGNKKLKKIKLALSEIKRFFSEHPALSKILKVSLCIITIVVISLLIHFYNNFARIATRARFLYAELGKEIRRRENLLPNLFIAIENYLKHEQEVFRYVSDSRELFTEMEATVQRIRAGGELSSSLSRLLALVEQYPDLKATQSVQDLIKELINTENRIAEGKAKYNDVAREFNQMFTMFPTNILGKIYGYRAEWPYISTDEDFLKVPIMFNFDRKEIRKNAFQEVGQK